jgi:hypothetical protein
MAGGAWRVGGDADQWRTTSGWEGPEGPGGDAEMGDGKEDRNLEKRRTTKMELSP